MLSIEVCEEDGDLLLDKLELFLRSYQSESVRMKGVGPLQKEEISCLPFMIKASNLYVLNWDVDDFYIKKLNPYEYLIYLQHNVRFMRWLERNPGILTDNIQKALQKIPAL